jgi:peptidoglycan/LPS O-acetylase OafA/YrhL
MQRLDYLDNVRGTAILFVIIYHYFYIYPEHIEVKNFSLLYDINNFLNFGTIGVSLFFILSGFLMASAMDKGVSPNKFLLKRFKRIFPVYWVVIIVTSIVYNYIGYKDISFTQFIMNFFMVQDILYGSKHIDGVFWSILIEIKFYILCFFIILFSQYKNIKYIFLLMVFFSIIAVLSRLYLNKDVGFGIFLYFSIMLNGMLFYKFIYNNENFFLYVQPVFLFYLFCVSEYAYGKTSYSYAWVISIILFLLFYKFKFKSKILSFFALISYSLYLIHQNLSYLIMNYFDKNIYLGLLFAFTISILFSYYLYKFIEKSR